ncbi:MAG: hypothetical protein A2Y22_02660 [Clostridiales bacterium GWD2_32_59]|nr:MAG: hypothetical protein A2Y22_02660 [Clostridiales bacterium GWD2_32_59]
MNNWFVLTGGPKVGKTTIINYLRYLGFNVYPEIARLYMDSEISKGRELKEVLNSGDEMENEILKLKIEMEKRVDKSQICIFDRSVIDSIAYSEYYGRTLDTRLLEHIDLSKRYGKIFLLEPLKIYTPDYLGYEDEIESRKIHAKLRKTYLKYGYEIVDVPIANIEERAEVVVNQIEQIDSKENLEVDYNIMEA